jgi:hypothetical protein
MIIYINPLRGKEMDYIHEPTILDELRAIDVAVTIKMKTPARRASSIVAKREEIIYSS